MGKTLENPKKSCQHSPHAQSWDWGGPRVDLRDNHPVNVEDPPCFSVDFFKR